MTQKKKLLALAAAATLTTLTATEQVWALDNPSPGRTDTYHLSTGEVGNCGVFQLSGGRFGFLQLEIAQSVSPSPGRRLVPGGAAIRLSGPSSVGAGEFVAGNFEPITEAALEDVCGLTNVQNLSATGPTPTGTFPNLSFASQTYFGTSFRATAPDGITYDYEYAFVGATGTRVVQSRTPVIVATNPEVTFSNVPETLSGAEPFTITATFSEDVTGFEDLANDLSISNAVVTAITGGPAAYAILLTPTGEGDVEISIPSGAATGASGLGSAASRTVVIRRATSDIAQEKIADFMLGRLNNLASNQPGLIQLLRDNGCRSFDGNATEDGQAVKGCFALGNAWADVTGAWSDDSSYVLGTLGAHATVNPHLLVGAMVQFDQIDDDANDASGQGWMVGPYFVAKTPGQPLFFEGRVLYGQSDNDITPVGTFTDSFDTERFLAQLRATGEYQVNRTTLRPLLDFTYADDTQKTYTDALGNTVSSQKVSLNQLTAGLDFSFPIAVSTGAFSLNGGLSGIYADTSGGDADYDGMRGRAELGFNYEFAKNGTLVASTFYDGIGSDYEGYGASMAFVLEF